MKNKFIFWLGNFFRNLPLVLTGIFFFVFSNPNFLFCKGFGVLAFFTYIPVLLCIHKSTLSNAWLQGIIFGTGAYGLYAYWIFNSYSEFFPVLFIGYGILFAILFELLKLIDKLYLKNGWVTQWLLICCFEYLKTFGFIGLSYGITAYTQWKNIYLIQICDLIGVYGLNAVIILFSVIIYSFIQKRTDKKLFILKSEKNLKNEGLNLSKFLKDEKFVKTFSTRTTWIAFGCWCFVFAGCYIYGFFAVKDYSAFETKTVAAIQNNENSWLDGIDVYTKNIKKLMDLTEEALELNPDIDLVVWPETSVVPAIVENYNNPIDSRRESVVLYLLNYINSKDCDFIIGNGHKIINKKGDSELYNAALYFQPGKNVVPPEPNWYGKMKLVPFSEYFPYENQFPKIYKTLKQKGMLNWSQGKEYTGFYQDGWRISPLICFEDTFPNIARRNYKYGGRCFVTLSNDSWSKSVACQNQHLAIALFRSIENRIPSIKSTASGTTCIIDPNGKIISEAPDFCEAYVISKVPVIPENRKPTFYSLYGNLAGELEIMVFLLLLIIQLINVIIKKYSKTKKVKFVTR